MTRTITALRRQFVVLRAFLAAGLSLAVLWPVQAQQIGTGNIGGVGGMGGAGFSTGTSFSGGAGSIGGSRSTSGTSGAFGTRALGQGVTAGQRTMGRGTAGGSAMGSSFGSAGTNSGMLTNSERFLRQNRQAGSFVGADSRDNTAYLLGGQGNAAGMRMGTNNARGMQNFNARNTQNFNRGANVNRAGGGMTNLFGALGGLGAANNAAGRARREVRTAMQVAFDHPTIDGNRVAEQITRRLNSSEPVPITALQRIRASTPVQAVRDSDGSLVLRGTVATERDRALAERLALLEPGVWKVRNEIMVSADAGQADLQTPTTSDGPPALGIAAPKKSN